MEGSVAGRPPPSLAALAHTSVGNCRHLAPFPAIAPVGCRSRKGLGYRHPPLGAVAIPRKSHRARAALPLLADRELAGKTILLREDLNVPLAAGRVANAARLEAALPTLRHCLARGAAVVLISHLGRPVPGTRDPALSLKPVAAALGAMLGQPVPLIEDWQRGIGVPPGTVALLENIRFEPGEETNDESLGRQLAALGDLYVLDAFATAHRAHASTCAAIAAAADACAGPLLAQELAALERALTSPARPLVAIVGGAKVSSKMGVLEALAAKADRLIVGGGIGNTFLLAAGHPVGASLAEADQIAAAKRIMASVEVSLPVDVMTGRGAPSELPASEPARLRRVEDVPPNENILDLGPETARRLAALVATAGTVLWNGPVGYCELDQFGEATRVLGAAVAETDAYSVAGGGDTLAAIDKYGLRGGISYRSTGGGAFMAFVAGESLPAVLALRQRAETKP